MTPRNIYSYLYLLSTTVYSTVDGNCPRFSFELYNQLQCGIKNTNNSVQ